MCYLGKDNTSQVVPTNTSIGTTLSDEQVKQRSEEWGQVG